MARRRRGRYKMTPRRRAALRKAQAASARKRRNQGRSDALKTIGSVAGTIAVGALIYHAEQFARHPSKVPKAYHSARGLFGKGHKKTDPNAPRMPQPLKRRPIKYYGRPKVPLRSGVGGRRISTLQRRAHQSRLF